MKILSFSYCFPRRSAPAWGVFVQQRLAALARRPDVELQVVSPVPAFPAVSRLRGNLPPSRDTLGELDVHYPKYFYFPKVLKRLDGWFYGRGLTNWAREFCRRTPPDLLDAHFIWPDGVGVAHISQALKRPYVITLRGGLWVYFRDENIKRQCLHALQNAAAVIALSDSMVDACCELGVSKEKFTVVHNGADRSLFHPGDKYQARRRLGLAIEGRIIVCVAFCQKRKGILELVQAMERLPEDVRLVLVGAKHPNEPAYCQLVLQEIDRLRLSQRVSMVGQQPHNKLPDYFRAADVSALTSYWEGCPNAVVESLACGTPVVATPVGSVPEMIFPDKNGRIVPMRDITALATALQTVIERKWNPNEIAATVCSWDDAADRVTNVFTKVLNGKPIV